LRLVRSGAESRWTSKEKPAARRRSAPCLGKEETVKAWQLPISGMSNNSFLHWFEVSHRTDRLVRAGCGRKFNPGFAQRPGKGLRKCETCKRRGEWPERA
jgi:hypothetical protein